MLKLFIDFDGDREKVLNAYADADDRGDVQRSRNANNTSSREYAIRLWANGMNQGWLTAGGFARRNKPCGVRAVSPVQRVPSLDLAAFEEGLRSIAIAWKLDASRPTTSAESRRHWRNLIEEWCECEEMPLPIRKTGNRGIRFAHPTGRAYVLCDNSPAHWAFMGCFAGAKPTLLDVRDQLERGTLPLCFARSRDESALINSCSHITVGGLLGSSAYGQVNRFPDGNSYKLCHIKPVGLRSRGEIDVFSLADIKDHVRRLLDPSNMVIVPLAYAGVGECQTFLNYFAEPE